MTAPGADPFALQAVLARHLAMQDSLRASVAAAVVRLWGTLAPYNQPEAARFTAAMVPLARGAATAMATATAAHLAQLITLKSGHLARPAVLRPQEMTGAALRNGTDPLDLWRRPFITLWWRLKEGDDPATARQQGLDRAVTLALTEVQLAKTHTAAAVLPQHAEVAGYRRITRGDTSCPLCTKALGPYPADELMPLHDRCGCDIDPILGDYPRHYLGVSDAIPIEQHGELGPVLLPTG